MSKTTKKPVTRKGSRTAKRAPAKKSGATKAAATKTSASAGNGKPKKLSAIDAAAKVLGESKQPLATKELIEAMEDKNYWKSPGGKTPDRTLYSAILREIVLKKGESRFKKTERGKFTLAK